MGLHSSSHSSSHANHSSSHSNHGNSTNSVSVSDTLGWSGNMSSGSHSVTASVIKSSLSSTHTGVYGSTGALSELKATIDEARSSYSSTGTTYTFSQGQLMNTSSLNSLLSSMNSSKMSHYKWGTIHMNSHASHSNSSGSSGNVASGSINKSSTNTANTANDGLSYTFPGYSGSNSSPGSTISGATRNKTLSSGSISSKTVEYSVPTPSAPSITSGTLITKNTLNNILANVKKVTDSTSTSFGTYKTTGSYNTSHSNHSSHSSSHSNHSNSHSNHSSSSRTLKYNIKNFQESALNIIKDIDIVSFYYKNDQEKIQHYGFIAEDTSEYLSTRFHDRMDYTNCIGLLLKAIQELNNKISELNKLYGNKL